MQIAVRHNLQVYDPADTSVHEDAAIVLPVREAEAAMGETVAAYLDRVAWRFDLPTICLINGEYYGRAEWAGRTIAVNDNIEFVSRPLGSGSGGSTVKSIASVVALVALSAAAGPLGTALAGVVGATGFAATAIAAVAQAAIVGAGALAISHFLSPKAGGKTASTDALYNFGFQGNAARPMQPIPVLNGRLRFAPDYGAPTYSEYSGDAMVDYALYAVTCGRWRPEQVLIGDTPIWDYKTGANPDYPGIEFQFVEPGEQVTLYPVNVVTADELSGAELSTTYTPGYIVNAAGTQAKELLLDFVWPGGAYHTGEKGKILRADTHILVRARTVDDAGAPNGPWQEIFGRIYSNTKQSQIRITERFSVTPGRYEVSVRRVNEPTADGNGTDAVTWTALRAHIDGPQSFPRVSMLAVKGVASKQLSGVSGGQLRVIGTRILPVWRDGLFVEEPTRSIAWAALDWWRNSDYSAGLSLSDTDFQAFVAYDGLWASLGHTFDHRFSEVQNLDDVLETVLKAGRAFPAPVGDKLTITRDQPRGLSRMLFTENDIVRDSLEIDYALSDEAWADGIVGEYVDQSTWRLAEVSSAPDGVQLLKPARVQLEGVVDRKQAAGMIRFMAAESQYRRITVSWIARMEGRLLKRGDLVKITAEEPETWGQSCEVVGVAANGTTLTLDPAPIWEAGAQHFVEIRRRDARPWGPVRVSRSSNDAEIAVDPEGDVAGLTDALARAPTQEAPWLAFSPGQPRTFSVLITDGDPDQDGEHIHLTGVIDAPEVYTTTEDGVPPLLQVPDLFSSAMPVILGLSAQASQRQLTIIVTAGWQAAKNAVSYIADVSYDAGNEWIRAYEGDRTTFEAVVGGSDQMRVRVAGVTPTGARGAFYIVPVEVPDLVVQNDLIAGLEDLFAGVREEIDRVNAIGAEALAQAGQLAERELRAGMAILLDVNRQLNVRLEEFAQAAATEAGAAYEARQFNKVAAEGRAQDNFAALERVDKLRISDKEAFAGVTTTLGARLTNAEGNIVGNAAALQSLTTTVTNVDGRVTSTSQAVTSLTSRVQNTETGVSGNAIATSQLTTRVSQTEGGISSLSQSYTALQAEVTGPNGRVSGQATAISNLSARVTQTEAGVSSVTEYAISLNSILSNHGGQLSGQATATQLLTSRVTTAEGNITSVTRFALDLNSILSSVSGQVNAQANALSSLTATTSNIDGRVSSQAQSLTVLSTTQNGHTSTLTQYGSSIDGISAQWGVAFDIDGNGGGFVFTGMRQLNGAAAYTLRIRGDLIVDGSITGRSLAVQNLITQSAQIGNLIVGNIQIADGAVSQIVASGSGGSTATVGIGVRGGARLKVDAYFNGNSNGGSTNGPGQLIIQRDGQNISIVGASFALFKPDSGNIQYYLSSMATTAIDQPGGGYHTYSAIHTNGQGVGGVTIVVTELSK